MVIGLGLDMIEVRRMEKQMNGDSRFKERIFTSKEISYCDSKKRNAENYAARFAAKEALLKALGTGWRDGLAFNEIEVTDDPLGKPEMVLHGKARERAEQMGVSRIHVSLTHLRDYAAAVVILEK